MAREQVALRKRGLSADAVDEWLRTALCMRSYDERQAVIRHARATGKATFGWAPGLTISYDEARGYAIVSR